MSDEETERLHWEQVEEAVELMQVGEMEDAKRELTQLAEQFPKNEYAHFFLGNLLYEEEDYARALKCFVAAIDAKPKYLGAMIGAGQCLRMLGDHERALRMGRQVLRIEANDPDALFLVGATFFQRGEYEAAYGPLRRFLETGPEAEVMIEVQGMVQICSQAMGLPG